MVSNHSRFKLDLSSLYSIFPFTNKHLLLPQLVCFSCLIPSALSFNLLAAKAVASQAAQDVVDIGTKTVEAKKEAFAKAASDIAAIAAKGISLKGMVSLVHNESGNLLFDHFDCGFGRSSNIQISTKFGSV